MTFACPQCSALDVLRIINSIELPPDSRSDEITLQLLICAKVSCGFRGVAIYEESRRGSLDSDHWDHTGYPVSSNVFERLKNAISQCPDPSKASCRCSSHQTFAHTSASGRWQPPEGIEWLQSFAMNLSGE